MDVVSTSCIIYFIVHAHIIAIRLLHYNSDRCITIQVSMNNKERDLLHFASVGKDSLSDFFKDETKSKANFFEDVLQIDYFSMSINKYMFCVRS